MRDFIDAYIESSEEPLLVADGFDAAILGIGESCGKSPAIVYDFNKCVAIMVERDGMTEEEAIEFMDFNVTGAYVGNHTPMFLRRPLLAYSGDESDERVKRLMEQVGMPNSTSLYAAFKQLENELWQKGVIA